MQVSVIIPVYNAAKYVRSAVESALAQPETAEVILIEDNSPDDSLQVCELLASEYDLVRLYRHPDGGNHGAGASRNLGIRMSRFPYIAFLDADDYFLPERFTVPRQIFAERADVDGVYEAIGTVFESEELRQQWIAGGNTRFAAPPGSPEWMDTFTQRVEPEDLFEAYVTGRYGSFSTIGLTVRREIFDKTGLFDERLRLHQDKAMWIKMAAKARLVPGRLDTPVSMRRVHQANRLSPYWPPKPELVKTRTLMWRTLWPWGRKNLTRKQQGLILNAYMAQVMQPYRGELSLRRNVRVFWRLMRLAAEHPTVMSLPEFWKTVIQQLRVRRLIVQKIAFWRRWRAA